MPCFQQHAIIKIMILSIASKTQGTCIRCHSRALVVPGLYSSRGTTKRCTRRRSGVHLHTSTDQLHRQTVHPRKEVVNHRSWWGTHQTLLHQQKTLMMQKQIGKRKIGISKVCRQKSNLRCQNNKLNRTDNRQLFLYLTGNMQKIYVHKDRAPRSGKDFTVLAHNEERTHNIKLQTTLSRSREDTRNQGTIYTVYSAQSIHGEERHPQSRHKYRRMGCNAPQHEDTRVLQFYAWKVTNNRHCALPKCTALYNFEPQVHHSLQPFINNTISQQNRVTVPSKKTTQLMSDKRNAHTHAWKPQKHHIKYVTMLACSAYQPIYITIHMRYNTIALL